MFSLQPGELSRYKSQFIQLLSEVDDSKYIFYAYVSHAYEDSSYNNMDKEELKIALSNDLETMGTNLTIDQVISINAPEHGGWPFVRVKNTKPMTIRQFIDSINNMYIAETFEYVINDCIDIFGVISEA